MTKNGAKIDAKDVMVNITPSGMTVGTDEDSDSGSSRYDWGQWRFSLVWFIYSLICLKRFKTTFGGKLCKLTVVRMDGKPLEKGDRLMRAATSLLSGYCFGLGYFWGLWEKDGPTCWPTPASSASK